MKIKQLKETHVEISKVELENIIHDYLCGHEELKISEVINKKDARVEFEYCFDEGADNETLGKVCVRIW